MRRYHFICAVLVAGLGACDSRPDPRSTSFRVDRDNVSASYDSSTGRLRSLEVDRDRNGVFEAVSYWDGPRLIRIEIDTDADKVVDRWEHYEGTPPVVAKVGSSSRRDGVEDVWMFASADGSYIARIEHDTTHDGRVDKWEEFGASMAPGQAPVLRAVGLDPQGVGHATRWLRYYPDGRFDRVEMVP